MLEVEEDEVNLGDSVGRSDVEPRLSFVILATCLKKINKFNFYFQCTEFYRKVEKRSQT